MATELQIVSVLRYLAAAYPRSEIAASTVAVYTIQLLRAQFPADVLLLAAMNLIDRSQWLPTIAELQAEARRIEGERESWYLTANHRLDGQPLPAELRPPDELVLRDDMALEWLREAVAGLLLEG